MTFSTTKGYDCSYYQAAIDFQKMKAYGANFVILRCGYAAVKDIRFDEYMGQVAGVLPISVYHYYDPIINPFDQAKKVIAILAPYKERINRVWLDFEFYWAGAYSAPEHWLNYRNAIEYAGYKTGIYTRATWWDSRVGTYAAEFGKRPCWAAQYNTVLNLIPKGWTKAMLWQKGTPAEGLAAGVSSKEIDLDIWNDEYNFVAEWGYTTPAPDEITTSHDGMTHITGSRSGWKFHLFVIDPAKFDFELVSTPSLETVKSVAIRKGATLATTAGEWVRETLKPQDYTVSNGVEIVTRDKVAARPSLLVVSDGHVIIDNHAILNGGQAFTGVRNIVGDLADPTKWNTEGHARTCFGLDISTNVMILLSEGVYPNQGLTLPECKQVLEQYGAVVAFDGGGGGDVGGVLDGVDLVKPENIINGQNVYRALPMTFCIYKKELVPMATTYTITPKASVTVHIFKTSIPSIQIADLKAGMTARGDNNSTNSAMLHVTSLNGTAINGYVYANQVNAIPDTVTPPPPPPPAADWIETTTQELASGSIVTTLWHSGKVEKYIVP